MEKTVILEFYFPIVFDLNFENYPFEQKEIAIREIGEVIDLIDFGNKEEITSQTIKMRHLKEVATYLIHPAHKSLGLNEDCINFSAAVTVDLKKVKATHHHGDIVEDITDLSTLEGLLLSTLPDEIGEKLFEVLLLSQIARPGSLKLREGVIWVNGSMYGRTISSPINLREAYEYHISRTYPLIDFIPFVPFYAWLKNNNLIFTEDPANVFQKAINNFSYLNDESDSITELIYQMMTLEQLYTDNNINIADQLDKKIQAFLGPMNTHKKQIKKMYDIRSRFLHGELPLKPFHREYDFDKFPEFESEISDACHLSVLIIISTLQKMYKENRLNLDFEYKLKN